MEYNLSKNLRIYILGLSSKFPKCINVLSCMQGLFYSNEKFKWLMIVLIMMVLILFIICICKNTYPISRFTVFVLGGIILYCLFMIQQSISTENILKTEYKENSSSDEKNEKKSSFFLKNLLLSSLITDYEKNNQLSQAFFNFNRQEENINKNSRLSNIDNKSDRSKHKNNSSDNKIENIESEEKKIDYINNLKENINKKNKTNNEYTKYKEELEKNQNKIDKYYNEFVLDFKKFLIDGEKIKDELLAIDISLDLYSYELKEIKGLIDSKFEPLSTKLNEKDKENNSSFNLNFFGLSGQKEKDTEKKESIKKKAIEKKEKNILVENKFGSFYSKLEAAKNNTNKSMHKDTSLGEIYYYTNLDRLQFFMILQGLLAFVLIVVLTFNMPFFAKTLRIFLFLFMTFNIFFGIFFMIFAEISEQKCLMKDVPTCGNQSFNLANEFILTLKSELNIQKSNKESDIQIVKTEFRNISNQSKEKSSELKKYLINDSQSQITKKFELFKSMFRNLSFIENDFDEIMKHKLNKEKFYKNISEMRLLTEKILNALEQSGLEKAIDLYSKFIEIQFFFKNEEKNFDSTIKFFVADEEIRMKKEIDKKCKSDLNNLCQATEKLDLIYLLMFLIGNVFLIGISFF